MRFSEAWLREWVDPPLDTRQLAEQLTMAGLEVDAVLEAAPPFGSVVVGAVLEVWPHPEAERLRVCRVEVGSGAPLEIVCGAPNARPGIRVPTALVGARLPGGPEIRKARIRGVESGGMLCSAAELGLSEDSAGILELPEEAPTGAELRTWLGLDDHSIELDLTPNRGDCLSVAGVAREVAALSGCELRPHPVTPVAAALDESFPVRVEAPSDCPRYVGRVIRDVDPLARPPLWMQERLRRSGLRSLGPVVDVTNYVLLELGQPMHAFDLDRLQGGILVRRARAGEELTLLNGQTLALDGDALVIADEGAPLALAGIMGGEGSGVEAQTRALFLESAFFTPTSIVGRPRRYGVQSDSSHRFERGVDPELQRRAMERATELLLAIVGGRAGPIVEVVDEAWLPRRKPVRLRAERARRVLGVELEDARIEEMLARLGMRLEGQGGEWRVHPPSWRFDIAIEEDLIEELARLYGYDAVPSVASLSPGAILARPESELAPLRLREVLVERGYQEAITYSFVDPELQQQIDPHLEAIALANPISADMSVMRTSLWTGLLQALLYNLNRQQPRVRLFEQGLRFRRERGQIVQEPVLAAVVAGSALPEQWGQPTREVDFYDAKADVEALLSLSGSLEQFRFIADQRPGMHPGHTARIERGEAFVGWFGEVHPALQSRLGIVGQTFLFELLEDRLHSIRVPRFEPISRFPAIRRDLALIVDESVSAQAVRDCITRPSKECLREVFLFDLYRGPGVPAGRKSFALGLILQDLSRTLTDREVDAAVAEVVETLRRELGATLRE